ncbi:hypothetical protein F5B22DRAFT_456959 [Xylaria bambusicola]|uniref:uncharacterized protein n=1 Tax=Xylaria bambusicola TaxID=326684 RepID=UPI002007F66E|nr:uncharacterized protein F5B22DRAFT_456959 [Xylaria bambusicola]KAI0522044.1 hypothetical protein F5B22DRAFT_456959 [Xylaria bambusicola]
MAPDPASLDHKESQETLVSLAELDPSPIDSPEEDLSEQLEGLSSATIPPSRATASSPGLGSSGHGPIFYLTRIQRYSSYTFTFFAGLHFANTSLIPLIYRSVPYSEPFLLMTRELYQTRLTEPLLVGFPILAHVASGFTIRLLRRSQNKKRYHGDSSPSFWELARSKASLSSSSTSHSSFSRIWPSFNNIAASGYVFSVLITSHIAMNRVLPLIVDGDSSNIGLAYVAHGFARHAPSAYIAYALLLFVGSGHMVWGMARWLNLAPPANWKKITFDKPTRSRRRRAWWTINAIVVSFAAVWAAGGLGVVARAGPSQGWLATVYDSIYEYAGR